MAQLKIVANNRDSILYYFIIQLHYTKKTLAYVVLVSFLINFIIDRQLNQLMTVATVAMTDHLFQL